MTKCVLALLLLPWGLFAQASNPSVFIFGTPPGGVGGACTTGTSFGYLTTTGQVVSCVSSVWTAAGTGGGGGLTIGTTTISGGGTNAILYGDGTNLQNALGVTRTGAGQFTFLQTNLGTTVSDALLLRNTTASTSTVMQNSNAVHFQGQGWVNGSASSQPVDSFVYLLPYRNDPQSAPSSRLVFSSTLNGTLAVDGELININGSPVLATGCATGSGGAGISFSSGNVITEGCTGSLVSLLTNYLLMGSAGSVFWTSSSPTTFAADTSAFRISAGIVGIGQGGASPNGTLNAAAMIVNGQPASSGQRFACLTTTGQIVSSATACVGT